jgi:hypothetical protein
MVSQTESVNSCWKAYIRHQTHWDSIIDIVEGNFPISLGLVVFHLMACGQVGACFYARELNSHFYIYNHVTLYRQVTFYAIFL